LKIFFWTSVVPAVADFAFMSQPSPAALEATLPRSDNADGPDEHDDVERQVVPDQQQRINSNAMTAGTTARLGSFDASRKPKMHAAISIIELTTPSP
jgi:hypothetical protein